MKRLLLIAGMLLGALVGSASCSSSDRVDLAAAPQPEGGPVLDDPSRKDASGNDTGAPRFMCIGTECPEPWETCNSTTEPVYKCGTDLSHDNNNCGACGNKCLDYDPIHMSSRCVAGACEVQCKKNVSAGEEGFQNWNDCNGLVEDGCETNLEADDNHCGACGNKCAAGIPCIRGQCGCSGGLILCNGKCVDPMYDNFNCGECGNACEFPADACDPLQPHTSYGCVEGKCGKKYCKTEFGITYVDCNKDVYQNRCDGDGCEVAGLKSRENCGACGNKCTGDEQCVNEGSGYECAIPCARAGKVLCESQCVDLLTDRNHCGTCGAPCRPTAANEAELHETATCKEGLCNYECQTGFGDCNSDPLDGCETDLRSNPLHCGGCGITCNVAAGQPCVEGKCLMNECDGGVTN